MVSTNKEVANRDEAVKALKGDNFLIYGRPKIGKSTLASQFPNPMFIATEPGLKYIQVDDKCKKYVFGWSDFVAIVNTLITKEHAYETIIIDTVDNLAMMCSEYVCDREGIDHPSKLAMGKGWAMVTSELKLWLNKIGNNERFTMVMIGHDKTNTIKTRLGEEYDFTTLNLGGKNRECVLAYPDHIFYCDIDVVDKVEKRVLRVGGCSGVDCGSRNPLIESKRTIELSYDGILNCLIKE